VQRILQVVAISHTGVENVHFPPGKHQGWIQGGRTQIGKNMIFWRKIVIFHTKYPTNFRASLCSAQFF
jgi:hypothetical protein